MTIEVILKTIADANHKHTFLLENILQKLTQEQTDQSQTDWVSKANSKQAAGGQPTKENIQTAAINLAKTKGKKIVIDILNTYNAKSIPQVEENKYSALLIDLQEAA